MVDCKVWRPLEGRIVIKMPYSKTNRAWLKATLGSRIRPDFNRETKHWEVARNHFGAVVEALAKKMGKVDVYMDFRESERCDTRCQRARSRECTCSCLGKHHGPNGITYGWKTVGEETLIRYTDSTRRHIVVTSGGFVGIR